MTTPYFKSPREIGDVPCSVITLRLTRELRTAIADAAYRQRLSMNEWLLQLIERTLKAEAEERTGA